MPIVFIFMLIISWLFSTLIHELGHAIPAMMLTKGKVKIIIGVERENDKNSISLYLGRLEIFMKLNPFSWRFGYCTHDSTGKMADFFILINGALTTFLFALLLFILEYKTQGVHPWLSTFVYAFLTASILDLYINLVPNEQPFYYNGIKMYNDGYQIKNLVLKSRDRLNRFLQKIEYHERYNEHLESVAECEKALKEFPTERIVHHKLLVNLSIAKNYPGLLLALNRMQTTIGLDYISFFYKGSYYLHEKDFEKADTNFTFAIQENRRSADSFNNRGYVRGLMGRYKESVEDLNLAISLNHKGAFAFNNRGFAFLMLGNMERAYEDLSYSMELDPNNAYCFRNFGIYFLRKRQHDIALIYLKKAREIDSEVPMLEQYEKEAKSKL